jgi:hypothetical protein
VQRANVAAAYAGYASERAFQVAVVSGDMPAPFEIGGADAWDITDLDEAVDAIKAGGKHIGNWRKGADDYASNRRMAGRRG